MMLSGSFPQSPKPIGTPWALSRGRYGARGQMSQPSIRPRAGAGGDEETARPGRAIPAAMLSFTLSFHWRVSNTISSNDNPDRQHHDDLPLNRKQWKQSNENECSGKGGSSVCCGVDRGRVQDNRHDG